MLATAAIVSLFTATLLITAQCQRSEQEAQLELAVRKLSAKISQPLPPKGIPFPSIPGPRCKSERIGVVGAGPSGTHMAYLLKKAGYNNIVILEKENRIGGKSVVVESKGSTYSLTTYLLTADYLESVNALMEEFGILDLAPADAVYLSMDDYRAKGLSRNALQAMSKFSPKKFLQDVKKYIDLHRELFGTYEGELMPRPDEKTSHLLRGSLQDYLLRNDMESMIPFLNLAMRQPGYDSPTEVGAAHALIYYTPRLIVQSYLGGDYNYTKNEGSMTRMFEEMVKRERIPVKFNFEVQYVRQNGEGDLQVFGTDDGQVEHFGFLVWSAPMKDLAKRSNIIKDPKDAKLLKGNIGKHVASSLVNLQDDIRKAPLEISLISLNTPYNNQVVGSFDTAALERMVPQEVYASGNYLLDGQFPCDRSLVVAQYGAPGQPAPSQQQLQKTIKEYYTRGFNASRVDVPYTFSTRTYFPRWSIQDVDQGVIWDLFDIQGKYGVWIVGGGASWDTVKSVMEYNKLILRQFNRADNQCPPKSSQLNYWQQSHRVTSLNFRNKHETFNNRGPSIGTHPFNLQG